MFDLETKLKQWRRSFEQSYLYGEDSIDELESHLIAHFDRLIERGYHPAEAFENALLKCGSESQVRMAFERDWKSLGWRKRILNRLKFERQCFTSFVGQATYAALRIYSIGFGLFCAFMWLGVLEWVVSRPGLPMPDLESGRFFYLQGEILLYTIVLSSLFLLTPFKRWSGKSSDVLRLLFICWILVVWTFDLIQTMDGVFYGEAGSAIWWAFNLGLGPVLWVTHTIKLFFFEKQMSTRSQIVAV